MDPRDDPRAAAEAPPPPTGEVAHDLRWAQDLRSSIRCALALLALLVLTDGVAGTLTFPRALLWCALAALLFLVLCPARITAGEGWLSSHGPLGIRRVRTDRLVSVRCLDGVGQRLVLRDAFGARLEIDPHVLAASPELWHRLDEDARTSALRGTLTCGESALRRVSERIDRETARTVFKVSGLD
ncbi:hypothetical protein [Streptomyces sp. NPDC018036]|uniref:hypothetical protein n=1 Tax=Streptomyces sp. NPDC018036 TaxID=3365035 RepID=UPI00379920B6